MFKRFIEIKFIVFFSSFLFLSVPVAIGSKLYDSVPKDLFEGDSVYKDESLWKAELEPKMDVMSFTKISSEKEVEVETTEVHFSADEMESNNKEGIIIAKGNVNIIREDISIQADEVIYNKEKDTIEAVGNVVLLSVDGSIVYSDKVNLKDKMNYISMENIKVVMQDKSNIAAKKVFKYSDDTKKMKNVVYSPCDLCEESDPLWQIKAITVRHNVEKKDVEYSHAFLEIKGVPVMYAPYFSHPDPTVDRRSGFLMPGFDNSNYLGANFTFRYFWSISEHENLLISPSYSTKVGPIMALDYEKYVYDGRMKFSGSYLHDDEYSRVDNDHRGHLFSKINYNINDVWTSDFDLNYVSDRSYFKDRAMNRKDDAWLNSSIKFQGFENRDYMTIEAHHYNQMSYALRREDKPYAVPFVKYEQIGDVNEYGFYNKNDISFASIYRRDDDSSYRASMVNSLVMPGTTSYGAKQKITASVKTDLYYMDNYENINNENFDGAVARIHPQLSYEWRLPFVKSAADSRQIIEPIVVGVLSPNGGNKPNKIANNDSSSSRLDDTNVLEVNRYSGYDINDTGSRVSYGLNWSYFSNRFGRSSFLVAQSYRTRKEDYFTNSQDDDSYFSDFFGHMYANPHKYLDLNYRFTLDKDTFDLEYSELSTSIGPSILSTYIAYIYLKDSNRDIISPSAQGERKELYVSLRSALTQDWSVSVYNRRDLTEGGRNLEYGGELVYEDDCFLARTSVSRDNSSDPRYRNNFEVKVDLFFKTLGGIGSN